MFRHRFLFGLALMVIALSLAAWVVSYGKRISVFHHDNTTLLLILDSGRMLIGWESTPGTAPRWQCVMYPRTGSWDGLDQRLTLLWLGFSYMSMNRSYLTIPLWLPGVVPLLYLWFIWGKTRFALKGKGFPVEPSIQAKTPST